jgi:hypothetical protein
MKNYLAFLFLFLSIVSYSQFGNRNQQNQRPDLSRNQPEMGQRSAPEINYEVEKYLGIVIYDIEKAAKKSKIKISSDLGKEFSQTLTVYNRKIKDIRRINSFTLRSTKEMAESFYKNAQKTGDRSGQKVMQTKMMTSLKPISETLKVEDLILDKKMKEILSEKQYKKWIKYNKKLYKAFPDPNTEPEEEIDEEN